MRLTFSRPVVDRWWRLVAFWTGAVITAWTVAFASLDRPSPPRREALPRYDATDALSTWDGRRYLRIATDGYTTAEPKNFIFFPLYPALMRATGGKNHAALSGIILSQLLCLASLILMSVMAHGRTRVPLIQEPGFWLLINPFGIFFLALYTESLFLFLTLVHFAAYERTRRSISATSGFLAGLTRPTSIALPTLLGTEAIRRWRQGEPWKWAAVAAAAPLLGAGLFVFGIVAAVSQDLLGYTRMSSQLWLHTATFPFYPYLVDLVSAFETASAGRVPPPDMILRLLSTPIAIGVLISQRRRLPASWLAYCAASLLFMHSVTPWRSTGRYEAVLFPVFFAIAGSGLARRRVAWIFAVILFAGWLLALYRLGSWRWVA